MAEGLEMVPPSGECLIKAQEHVFKLMQTDTYSRPGFILEIYNTNYNPFIDLKVSPKIH